MCIVRRPAGTVEGILRHSAAKFKLFRSHAVLLHMYTAMYGGRMLNAAPLPALPIVMACVCAPAAAIATECVCAPAEAIERLWACSPAHEVLKLCE